MSFKICLCGPAFVHIPSKWFVGNFPATIWLLTFPLVTQTPPGLRKKTKNIPSHVTFSTNLFTCAHFPSPALEVPSLPTCFPFVITQPSCIRTGERPLVLCQFVKDVMLH